MRRTLAVVACLPLLVLTACAGAPDVSPAEADEIAASEGGAEDSAAEDGTSGDTEGSADDETSPEGAGEGAGSAGSTEEQTDADVEAMLMSPGGTQVGTVEMTEMQGSGGSEDRLLEVHVTVENQEPGFKGFHVHQTGLCEPDSASPTDPGQTGAFLSAGGHLALEPQGENHGAHAGDMPSIRVGEDGTGSLTFMTDAFTLADLQDGDGSAVMVHEGPDNFANIPERYAPEGPDEETLGTGDSGGRAACAVVER